MEQPSDSELYPESLRPRPLEEFVDALHKDKRVRQQITEEIIARLNQNPESWKRMVRKLVSEIEELVYDEAVDVKSITARGAWEDPFKVQIRRFGPVRFVSTNEFNDIGYFDTTEKARVFARLRYSEYL